MSLNLNHYWKDTILTPVSVLDVPSFDEIDEEIMYRGIPKHAKIEAEFEGTHLPNQQIYGPGVYFSYNLKEASDYAGKDGTILICKLRPDANLVVDTTVDRNEWLDFETLPAFFGKTDWERKRLAREYKDVGVDAYITGGGDHVAVLDRSKIICKQPKIKPKPIMPPTIEVPHLPPRQDRRKPPWFNPPRLKGM